MCQGSGCARRVHVPRSVKRRRAAQSASEPPKPMRTALVGVNRVGYEQGQNVYQPLFVCLSNWWPDPAVDLPIRLWSNACSPVVEAHVILWGHGHRRASADVAIARRHAAPGQRNGASRSLGAPQSRIGVPGGRATTRHPSLQLVKLRKPPGFFRRWHTQKSRASRRSSREHRGRGARHGSRQAAAATAGGKRHAGVIHVDTSCQR